LISAYLSMEGCRGREGAGQKVSVDISIPSNGKMQRKRNQQVSVDISIRSIRRDGAGKKVSVDISTPSNGMQRKGGGRSKSIS
jgi:hypothetical protein